MTETLDTQQFMASALRSLQSGNAARALEALDQVLRVAPEHPAALVLKARLHRQKGDFQTASTLLQRAEPHAAQQPQFVSECGYLALSVGDAANAVAAFSRLVELRPAYPDGHYNLAQALQLQGRIESAIVHLERALELNIGRPHEVRAELGFALMQRRREDDAQVEFEQALSADPTFALAHLGIGLVQSALGQFDDAEQAFRSALRHDPGQVEALQQIIEARRFGDVDDPDILALRDALASPMPPFKEEKLRFALGKAMDDCGEHAEAWQSYARANELKGTRTAHYDAAGTEALVRRIIQTFSGSRGERAGGIQDDALPIIIVGMPRSGTTLVELMLARHPDVDSGGELDYFERVARSALAPYPEGVDTVGNDRLVELSSGYLEELRQHGSAQHVIDKYPANFFHLGTISELFPNAALVHCRRDPLDTSLSIFFQDFSTGNAYANSLDNIAHYYRQYLQLMAFWREHLGERLVEVDYESVVDDAEGQVRRLLDHIGLDFDPRCLDPDYDPAIVSTLSRWQVRQPVYGRSVGRWRHYRPWIEPLAEALDIEL